MNKQTIITILFALVAMAGQAQTPKDSCSIPKDSLSDHGVGSSDHEVFLHFFNEKYYNIGNFS